MKTAVPILISVHIPKTGGTSFRMILEQHFGSRLLYDYQDYPMARRSPLPQWRALLATRQAKTRLINYECVHGHFLAYKYHFIRPARRAIWLRDPIDRLVSRYHHYQRDVAQGIHLTPQYQRFIRRPDLTLDAFARISQFHNVYARFLWGESLERFDFVGITERFDSSLRLFTRLFEIGDNAQLHPPAHNVNPHHQVAKPYELPARLNAYLRRVNDRDLRLYEQALERNADLARC
ncbi:sulfotransferase family 2 domain-containing protein [Thiospirillum jenense]|uniref:Sulfotransferase family 2 domain-containing protein n=1 Tax=Thiospirillum jenense TaxID=1653858 RepID=A0A839HNQ4_9GAMM|nr:sulfotransferase family 2 domain-containing protein [Thiospirillum jenense]MBB1126962.1 sulfotransferase family 2 domain-containing protein [Thiospirillum jenense]